MSLLNSLQYVVSAYGEKLGVNVVPSATAFTNGRTIHTVIDEENPDATWGFTTHEAAHVRFTDFKVIKKLPEFIKLRTVFNGTGISTQNLMSVVNCLEDNRIEFQFSKLYPGSKQTFNSMNKLLIDKNLWKVSKDVNPLQAIEQFCLFHAAGSPFGHNYDSCKTLSDFSEKILKSMIPSAEFQAIKNIVLRSVDAESTLEIVNMSCDVLEIAVKLQEKAKQDSNDSGDAQDSNDSGDAQDSNDSGDAQSSNDSGDAQSSSDSGDAQRSNDSGDAQIEQFEFSDNNYKADKGELMTEFFVENSVPACVDDDFRVYSKDKIPFVDSGTDHYQKGVESSAKLQSRLKNLLEARARTKRLITTSGRKISKRKLSRLPTGNTKIFARKHEGFDVNTSIYISMDISSSMNSVMEGDSRLYIDNAKEALSAVAYAIDRNGGRLSFSFYNVGVVPIKSFDDPIRGFIEDINNVKPTGCTRFCPAFKHGIRQLISEHKTNRKVFILVTDGEPDDVTSSADIVNQMQEAGIEVYCIGMKLKGSQLDQVRFIFKDKFINVQQGKALSNELMGLATICL